MMNSDRLTTAIIVLALVSGFIHIGIWSVETGVAQPLQDDSESDTEHHHTPTATHTESGHHHGSDDHDGTTTESHSNETTAGHGEDGHGSHTFPRHTMIGLAGFGFIIGAIAIAIPRLNNVYISIVGVPFVLAQMVLWVFFGLPHFTIGLFDKVVQTALIALLVYYISENSSALGNTAHSMASN